MDLEWYFYAATAAVFLLTGLTLKTLKTLKKLKKPEKLKSWRIAALAAYVFFIFAVTILSRSARGGNHFAPRPFWSWSEPQLRQQILMNIVGFIPLGIIGASLWKWKIIPVAAGISLLVEIIQLVTKTGLFETDDVIHNTLGAVIGCGLFILITTLIRRKK